MDPAFARCAVYCPAFRRRPAGVPTANADKTSASEPDVEQKRAAYAALADVLANDAARQELIDQLRKAAATPPPDSTPTLTAAGGERRDHRAGRTSRRSAGNMAMSSHRAFPVVAQYYRLAA
ncbi:Potassium efflux system KefA protein / Small-conductance mechanosensitive channel [Klebsiella pneumoniae]|uniref:Potassium efflux system KefA protein / Small-conductance mechanosensitive channel n=1 Tax=Klebsiella pneumoniae TaxID=573 RepID=A0A2X3EXJ2_KLEPN|nr:Potassium efflux system KefA protein / Small-conductance mechanosensitive channel [Klebsiella pneumoniae]